MSSHPKFLDLCLEGKAVFDDIDDFIDQWHETPQGYELHDYLGMTNEEYSLWLRAPEALAYIIKARREMQPLKETVVYACQDLGRVGRSSDQSTINQLQNWLKAKGEFI